MGDQAVDGETMGDTMETAGPYGSPDANEWLERSYYTKPLLLRGMAAALASLYEKAHQTERRLRKLETAAAMGDQCL